jgi:predicted amidohydrolase YtcJ
MDERADLVLRNGRVSPGPVRAAEHTAVAVRDGRILAVGSDPDVDALIASTTTVVDLGGRRVVPGLIDSHIHMVRSGLTWGQQVDWSGVRSLEDGLAMIAAEAEQREAGSWICVVGGWGPGQFREGRGPTREELDAVAPGHAVYVQYLYESALLNTTALAAAGVTADSGDPARGSFERAPDGTPTGLARGVGAFQLCLGLAGRPDFETQVEWTAAMMRRLNRLGVTGVIDPGGMGMSPEAYRPLHELWRREQMTVRTRLYLMPQGAGVEREQVEAYVRHLHPGFGDDWLRLVGMGEIVSYGFMDLEGVRPFEVTREGRELLLELLVLLIRNRWSVHLHAVMTATISAMLDVIEQANAIAPIGDLRFSLAHAEPITDRDLDRVQALGMGIGIQDRMVFRAKDSADLWGEDVVRRSPPLRGILDRGIPLGGGTDATVVSPYDPWRSLWWLITGRTLDGGPDRLPEHRLTRAEALEAYTLGSAWFSHDEGRRGRLAPGLLADLAVLSDDVMTVPDDAIPEIRSALTVVGGRAVHLDEDDAPDVVSGSL